MTRRKFNKWLLKVWMILAIKMLFIMIGSCFQMHGCSIFIFSQKWSMNTLVSCYIKILNKWMSWLLVDTGRYLSTMLTTTCYHQLQQLGDTVVGSFLMPCYCKWRRSAYFMTVPMVWVCNLFFLIHHYTHHRLCFIDLSSSRWLKF